MKVFDSPWQAGFEGADHVNRQGLGLAMNQLTGHLSHAPHDYAALKALQITTVRESVGWRLVEQRGRFDFSSLESRLEAAQRLGIQICWTFCHYGWPEDIDLFSDRFVPRFARFCGALAAWLAPFYDRAPVYSPINEISFTSWGLAVQLFHCRQGAVDDVGREGKRQLVRAALAGCDAIWAVDSRARILHCDPLIHLIASPDGGDESQAVAEQNAAQYEAWDMLCGRREPELGGAPRYLDIIGANYYHSNQWEYGSHRRLHWHLGDPRRKPLHQLLNTLYQRYQRPVLLAETGHIGSGRGAWVTDIAGQVAQARLQGTDVAGICLYPAIDRPDWEDIHRWHHSGLWDVVPNAADPLARTLCQPYATALLRAQRKLDRFQMLFSSHCPSGQDKTMQTIIVFSHLRWDFVWQRPQQLLSRLAQHFAIVFVEEPVYSPGAARLEITTPAANVSVCRPHTPVQAAGFHDDQRPWLQPLINDLMAATPSPIAWLYTPMALPLLTPLDSVVVIYDCMDELAAFNHAPRQLLQRESALLARAEILFTGGPSLHRAKQARHDNAFCFPSSVDAVHFEQALDKSNDHPLQRDLPHPRLGFYGVIDERLDLPLLAALADQHPDWQCVIVGPVVKIAPDNLPRRHNIHYYGQQPYQALPQFLAGWDVCLLPFARNDATRFISPTKVLEYMAAHLPVVSTAITDVVKPYAPIVAIGHDTAGFIAACEERLALPPERQYELAAQMQAIVAATSWDESADKMAAIIQQAVEAARHRSSLGGHREAQPRAANDTTTVSLVSPARQAHVTTVPCAILGAGPTGLSAAYHYGTGSLLLERHREVGGWCRSIEDNGFTFDYAGHIMFSHDPYVLGLYEKLLGDNMHWQDREAWIYSQGVYSRYPFQGALYGLPPAVIKECLLGAIAARFPHAGTVSADSADAPHVDGPGQAGRIPGNFEQFIHQVWGDGIGKHFALPYNQKLWTVPLSEMETSWLGGRVPLPDLDQIISGALEPVGPPQGPNARFGYPLKGGFQALMSGFLPHLHGELATDAEVVSLQPEAHLLTLADGRRYRYGHLITRCDIFPYGALIWVSADRR